MTASGERRSRPALHVVAVAAILLASALPAAAQAARWGDQPIFSNIPDMFGPAGYVTGRIDSGGGDHDLVAAGDSPNGASLFVLLQDPSGTFNGVSQEPMGSGEGLRGGNEALALGDVDGDGDLDLVAQGSDSGGTRRLYLFRNNGGAGSPFDPPVEVLAGLGLEGGAVALGDLDGDLDLDLVATGQDAGDAFRFLVFLNDGSGVFAAPLEPKGAGAGYSHGSSIALGNIDGGSGDTDADVVVTGGDSNGRHVDVWRNDGSGQLTLVQSLVVGTEGLNQSRVRLADLDGDLDLDLIAAGNNFDGSERTRLVQFRNAGGTFETTPTVIHELVPDQGGSGNASYAGLAVGDADGDGRPDAFLNGNDGAAFHLFFFDNPAGTLAFSEEPPASFVGPVVFGDFDGDQDLDLVGLPVRSLYVNQGPILTPGTVFVTNGDDDGPGSLRDAVSRANSDGGPTTIRFTVSPAPTIRLLSQIDLFEDGTTIDGDANGDGRPDVVLDGGYQQQRALDIASTGNTIRGLVVTRFRSEAIRLGAPGGNTVEGCQLASNQGSGVAIDGSAGNVVRGCWIGTDAATAREVRGNERSGVMIRGGASDNVIGPDNVIAFNASAGGLDAGVAVLDGSDFAYPDFTGRTPDFTGSFTDLNFPSTRGAFQTSGGFAPLDAAGQPFGDTFGARFTGTLNVAVAGTYTFTLEQADDNLRVDVDGGLVIERSFAVTLPQSVTTVLTAGDHPIAVAYFDGNGAAALVVRVTGPGAATFPGGLAGELFRLRVPSERNRITRNSIFANFTRGIDLDAVEAGNGVNVQDAGDADAGPNGALNFPIITSAAAAGGVATVQGTATPSALIELFGVDHDPPGNGEGYLFLATATADALTGAFSATFVLPTGTATICATATDPDGNTSEFSQNRVVGPPPGNDEFTSATVIPAPAAAFEAVLDVAAATTSTAARAFGCATGPTTFDVWFAYTPLDDEVVTVDTLGSSYNTFIAVFTDPAAGVAIACTDHGVNVNTAAARFVARRRTTYYIAIGSNQGSAGTLRVRVSGARPSEIDVLLYENGGGLAEQGILGALLERGAIRSYSVYDARSFGALSTREVAAYDVILIGWAGFTGSPAGPLQGNAPTDAGIGLAIADNWQAAVTGNVALTCLDPDLHFTFGGANVRGQMADMLENLLVFAASGVGTGLVALSDPIGNFGFLPPEYAVAAQGGGGDDVVVAAPAHPLNTTPNRLTDRGLSRFGGSYHNEFTSTGGFAVVHRSTLGVPLTLAGRAPVAGFGVPGSFAAGADVLVYENGGSVSEAGSMSGLMAREAVRMYSVFNRHSFPRLSTAEIAAYDLLFVGWSGLAGNLPRAVNANAEGDRYVGLIESGARWRDAIRGRAVVTGEDPDRHYVHDGGNPPALLDFLENAVAFAGSGPGTGLVATSDALTSFNWLPFGPSATLEASRSVTVTAPAHPLNTTPNLLTGAGLATAAAWHNSFRGTLGQGVVHVNAIGEPLTWVGEWPFAERPAPDFGLPLTDGEHVVFLVPSPAEGNIFLDFREGRWRVDPRADGDGADDVRVNGEGYQDVYGGPVGWAFFGFAGEQVDVTRAAPLEPRRHNIPLAFDAVGAAPTVALETLVPGVRRTTNPFATKYLLLADKSRAIKMKLYGRDALGRFVLRYSVRNVASPAGVDPATPATLPAVPTVTARPTGVPPAEAVAAFLPNVSLMGTAEGVLGYVFDGALAPGVLAASGVRRRPPAGTEPRLYIDAPALEVVTSRFGRALTLVSIPTASAAQIGLDEASRYHARLLGADGFDYAPYGFTLDLTPPQLLEATIQGVSATAVVARLRARDRSNSIALTIESDRTGDFRPNVLGAPFWDDRVPLVAFDGAPINLNRFEALPFTFAPDSVTVAAGGGLRFAAPTLHDGPLYRIVLTDEVGNRAVSGTFLAPGARALPPAGRISNARLGRTYAFIQDALDDAAPGDTIALAAGTYTELATVPRRLSGAPGTPTVIRAAPGADVRLDGEGRLATLLAVLRAHDVRVEGIRFSGSARRAVHVFAAQAVTITGCEVTGSAGVFSDGIQLEETSAAEVASSTIRGLGRWGIIVSQGSAGASVHNDLIVENARGGLLLFVRATGATIANNTIHGNGHFGGISLSDGSTGADIRNNLVTSNRGPSQGVTDPALLGGGVNDLTAGGLGGAPNAPVRIAFNDVFDNRVDYLNVADRAGVDGNISADPLYVTATADFRLQPESPAVDAGDPASPVGAEPGAGPIDMGRHGGTVEATAPPPLPAPAAPPPSNVGGGCAFGGMASADAAGAGGGLAPYAVLVLALLGARRRRGRAPGSAG